MSFIIKIKVQKTNFHVLHIIIDYQMGIYSTSRSQFVCVYLYVVYGEGYGTLVLTMNNIYFFSSSVLYYTINEYRIQYWYVFEKVEYLPILRRETVINENIKCNVNARANELCTIIIALYSVQARGLEINPRSIVNLTFHRPRLWADLSSPL